MKTSGNEMIRVESVPVDDAGNKIEPEEQIATEAVAVPIEANLSDRASLPGEAPAIGHMPSLVGVESTAGEVARDVATRCELCEHWRHEDWLRHLAAIQDTPEGDRQINTLRGELLGLRRDEKTGLDLDDDLIYVNIAIKREFGICAAFTESTGMVTASPFYGGCPADDPRFKMRDRDAQRQASTGYDKILRLAQGKKE